MSVKTTLLHGMRDQIEQWIPIIRDMDGFAEEDYNDLFELLCSLDDCIDHIVYALKTANSQSETVV